MHYFLALAGLACATSIAIAPFAADAKAKAKAKAFQPSRFTVTTVGTGPDVILIPGLASSPKVYAPLVARLKGHYRLHLVQISGFAGAPSAGNRAAPVVSGMVDELATYVTSARLSRPAIIGHSLGGEAALMFGARYPGLPGKLMVIDALPFFSLLINPAATEDSMKIPADQFRATTLAMNADAFKASQVSVSARLVKTDAARAGMVDDSLVSDRAVIASAAHELMTTDLRPELPKIVAPLTVLYAYDPIMGLPADAYGGFWATAYGKAQTAKLTRIDGSYHFIMWDQPEAFAQAVTAFLAMP